MATGKTLIEAAKHPNVRTMLNVLSASEGADYNTSFGGGKFTDFSAHPDIQKGFTQTDGKKNSSGAAGRYQFLKGTWDALAKKYGLKDFSPENQDLGAIALLAEKGALDDVLKGDFDNAINKVGSIWASLPTSPYKQKKRSWEFINDVLAKDGIKNKTPFNMGSQGGNSVLAKAVQNFAPNIGQAATGLVENILNPPKQASSGIKADDQIKVVDVMDDLNFKPFEVVQTEEFNGGEQEPDYQDKIVAAFNAQPDFEGKLPPDVDALVRSVFNGT